MADKSENTTKTTRKQLIQGIGAFLVMAIIASVGFYTMNGGFSQKEKVKQVDNTNSGSGLSSRQVLKKFILATGNIGDINVATYDNLLNKTEMQKMSNNRLTSLANAKEYTANNSDYLSDFDKSDVIDYLDNSINPMYYSIKAKNVLLSEPVKTKKTAITGNNNTTKYYETVKIKAKFTSDAYMVIKTADDSAWDGTYNVKKDEQVFDNVNFTMIKQSGEWRVYAMTKADSISTRFATWNPAIQKLVVPDYTNIKKITKGANLSGTD